MSMRAARGFTLLEVMLVGAALAVLSGMSYVVYTNAAQTKEMDIALRSSESFVRLAMARAYASEQDSAWGVQFDQPLTVLFKGDSFGARDTAFDEALELPNFELSEQLEYVFEKGTGVPVQAGEVVFTNEYTGEVRRITINEKGRIAVE